MSSSLVATIFLLLSVLTLAGAETPNITLSPQSQTYFVGESAVFSCSASDAVSYEWLKDGRSPSTKRWKTNGEMLVYKELVYKDNGITVTCRAVSSTGEAAEASAGLTVMVGGCTYNGRKYALGSEFPADDGCNTCNCIEGVVSCTEIACPPQSVCIHRGRTLPEGQKFVSDDGCNECHCSGGSIGCTETYCIPKCCCGTAKYRLTMYGNFTQQLHPYKYPQSAHFSPLIGATHSQLYSLWRTFGFASLGVKSVCETGASSTLRDEMRAAAAGIHSVISGSGISTGDGSVETEFSINCTYPFVSVISMIAPSPDWIVGINSLRLCRPGGWLKNYHTSLPAYDCGTDSGVSYTSPDAAEKERRLIMELKYRNSSDEASAFYDMNGGFIPPFADLKLEFLSATGDCPEKDTNATLAPPSQPSPACPANKVFKQCGSACPLTCAKPIPGLCIALCVSGCFCQSGMLLNDLNECVSSDQCPGVGTTKPTIPVGGCTYNGRKYALGSEFPADDGCNTCNCIEGVVSCTEIACPPQGVCIYRGRTLPEGQKFLSDDGCNECHCSGGSIGCTEAYCIPKCCCGTAKYRLTMYGNFTQQLHPYKYPQSAHFSPLIGATHSELYSLWRAFGYASLGVKSVCETGATSTLREEMSAATGIHSVISGSGISTGDGSVETEFSINCTYPFVSVISMIAPSPDWIVGINSLRLCRPGGWLKNYHTSLPAYDCGTDSGVSYTSPNAAEKERRLIVELGYKNTSNKASAFYDKNGGFIPPFADLKLEFLSATGDCPEIGGCTYNGRKYALGSEFPADDGCNTCNCIEGVVSCTEIACPPQGVCIYRGRALPEGQKFLSDDGCNECHCSGGSIGCTEAYCIPKCCCGTAKYRLTMYGNFTQQLHPYKYPQSAHFSPLIGATHSELYSLWRAYGYASLGVKSVCETGATSSLRDEMRAATGIHSVISGSGISTGDGSVETEFSINCTYPFVSVISMIAPSPDWIVGINSLRLCRPGGWLKNYHTSLPAYDCGTDSGVSYTSPNAAEKERRLIVELGYKNTSNKASAFYDMNGGFIPPFADLKLEFLSATGDCPESVGTHDTNATVAPSPRPSPACSANKVFKQCGSPCQLTCAKPNSGVCVELCFAGCFCPSGMLLNDVDECVSPDQCPGVSTMKPAIPDTPCTIQRRSEMAKCGDFVGCFVTLCEDDGSFMARQCHPSTGYCWCLNEMGEKVEGTDTAPFLLKSLDCTSSKNDTAVPTMPSVCPDGEVFTECGTACPLRCDELGSGPRPCTLQCVIGCFCPDGLYRNARNECVPVDQCPPPPPKCPNGSVYNTCGTACPLTCDDPHPRICTKQCVRGCFCRDGLYQNARNECVPVDQCPLPPPKCPNGSVYNTCGTACPLTCDDPHPRPCTKQCVRGCFCPTGMLQRNSMCVTPDECKMCHYNNRTYRNGEGFNSTDGCNKCVCIGGHVACTRRACRRLIPPLLCPNGKEYHRCGTACPPTCKNAPLICTLQCVRGCFCPRGLVEHNNQCVKPSKCPPQSCVYGGKTYQHNDSFPASDGCNRCGCSNGRVLCTLIACPTTQCAYYGKFYQDGDNFTDFNGCNTCLCTAGVVACTEKLCNNITTCQLGNMTYKVGETFLTNDGCHTCKCPPSGYVSCLIGSCPMCTYNGKRYRHRETFMSTDMCNTCVCQRGRVICTLKLCVHKFCMYDGVRHEDGTNFTSFNATALCTCHEGVVSCIELVCPAKVGCVHRGKILAEGDSYLSDDSCNDCVCNGGTIGCTERGCEPACCCGRARYRLTIHGNFTRENHPYNFPVYPHFSPVITAVHSSDYTLWREFGLASPGVQSVCETGSSTSLLTEIRRARGIHSVVTARGINGDGRVETNFTIDCSHPFVSVISMIAPSPDWIIGISALRLCRGAGWLKKYHTNLTAYDCGTDSGVSYTSPNATENPHRWISELRETTASDPSSAFYDPHCGIIRPFATLTLDLVSVDGECPGEPVVAVPTPAQAKPTPSPSICPMNKTFGCGSVCPLTCSHPSVRVCTEECVFDCNCPRGLLDAGDVCVTGNSCSGLPSGCELVRGKKELLYLNGCRSVRRVFVPKCMGRCTGEDSRARCRATNGLKEKMVEFRCKPKEKGAKKYTTTMPIAVAESCSCSVV
ncbi:uncharacterized protein LOC134188563 [Corticium candelabrum]|uniref:uncharacterized protein LOC134188563 n=1 Tax=Corticium candelabrum TaxID=121492 RepID=UPI002E26509D|nr:uncharacterized protein LOC134188563 [Corticium candelabrum]